MPAQDAARWVDPKLEQLVYENSLFDGDLVPFRAARCYLSESRSDRYVVMWLEDLSSAVQPPWNLENFVTAAHHLGQFNGFHSLHLSRAPFSLTDDHYYARWGEGNIESSAVELSRQRSSDLIRQAYKSSSVDSAIELSTLVRPVLDIARSLPHALAFGVELEEVPGQLAPVMALIPRYVEEVKQLLK
ncbi:MAG: hypothetical protein O3B95_10065 [Chloroflexi bacterium]|nr:hypothetical protein [Chloroflexota bacterium]